MKKIVIILFLLLVNVSSISADDTNDIKRIIIGNKDAKIKIIAYESLIVVTARIFILIFCQI